MSATVAKLIEVLERSESVYRQLVPVFQKENQAALGSEPEKLSSAVAEKAALFAQIQTLERRRQLIINQISSAWRIPVKELRLSMLADRTAEPQATQIRRLTISLKELVQKINQANEENRRLIQHCLNIVHGALGFFQHWMISSDVYGASGQLSHQGSNGHLVSGAI